MISVAEIIFLVIIFLTNIVQTITGFAGTVLAMPFSIRLISMNEAKPILNAVALVASLFVVILHFKDINWKELWKMLLFLAIGFIAGFFVSPYLDRSDLFLQIYGLLIVMIAVIFYMDFNLDRAKIPSAVLFLILIAAGFLHQLYVSGGPLVVIYAHLKLKDKHEFRATLSFVWVILNTIMLGQHIFEGLWNVHMAIILAIGVGVSSLAVVIGHFLAKKIQPELFMRIAYILLFISGASLLVG